MADWIKQAKGNRCGNCIWYGRCGIPPAAGCRDFSPLDSAGKDEAFYRRDLNMRGKRYHEIVADYEEVNAL